MHRIVDQILDINGLEARKQELTGNNPTAFMFLFGHTASIDISVYFNGWDNSENCYPDYSKSSHFAGMHASNELNMISNDLARIKEQYCV